METIDILGNQYRSFNNLFAQNGPFSELVNKYGAGNKIALDDKHSAWVSGFEFSQPEARPSSELKEFIRANRTFSGDLYLNVQFDGPGSSPHKPVKLHVATIPCPTTDSEFIISSPGRPESCRYTMTMKLALRDGAENCEDKRSLLNRRVIRVGEILLERFEHEFESFWFRRNRFGQKEYINALTKGLPKGFLQRAVDRIFNPASNPLFQLLDTTNPLAEVSQKRRITLRGYDGIPKQGLFLSMRDAHPHDIGCICPAETPQGADLGCTLYLARGARINEKGILETAVTDIKEGKELYFNTGNIGGKKLCADPLPKDGTADVQARSEKLELITCRAEDVDLQLKRPDQILGYAAAMIPFIRHNDANRCLMGANMMKQAVAIEGLEPPLVQTGVEQELGRMFEESGFTRSGTLCLGRNLLTAYMPWDLLNYEDAIVVNERICEHFTHTEKQDLVIDEIYFKGGNRFEEITRENPWLDDVYKEKLDKFGVIREGEELTAGDVLVSRVRFFQDSGRGKRSGRDLLNMALGLTYRNKPVQDKSIRVPAGMTATVTKVSWEIRKGWEEIFEESGQKPKGAATASAQLPDGVIRRLRITLSISRKLSTGDKLTGRHGNKGVVGKILPERRMPYFLTEKTACSDPSCNEKRPHRHVEILLNPLTITGRLNLGQLYETTLGLLADHTGKPRVVPAFSRKYSWNAITKELSDHGIEHKHKLFFADEKQQVVETDRKVTVGFQYFLKLKHLSKDKLKARHAGVLDQVTGQPAAPVSSDPLQRKILSSQAPQRLGEMEVWALMGHGAWNIIDELLYLNSDEEHLWKRFRRSLLWPGKEKSLALEHLNRRLRENNLNTINSTEQGLVIGLSDAAIDRDALSKILRSLGFIYEYDESEQKVVISYDPVACMPRYPRATKVLAQYLRVLGLELEIVTPGEYFPLLDASYKQHRAAMRIRVASDHERSEWASTNIVMVPGTTEYGLWSDLLFGDTGNVLDRDAVQNAMGVIKLKVDVPNPLFLGNCCDIPTIRNLMVLPKALRPERNERDSRWRQNSRMPRYENDFNILYSWILTQNIRIGYFEDRLEPGRAREQILENEKKRLCQLVTALLANKKIPGKIREQFNLPMKYRPGSDQPMQSVLSKITGYNSGKDGLMRKNLLGKRVNFSARAVIVPDPELGLDEAGIPVEIGLAIFRELLLSRILARDIPVSIKNDKGEEIKLSDHEQLQKAKAFLRDPSNAARIREYLDDLASKYLVLLNRNPSLHRLSILAFHPVLHEKGDVITLNPWVCAPFNADFDGDTMAVFLPARKRSQKEAAGMLPSVVLRSPANGKLIISDKKDMALAWKLMKKQGQDFSDVLEEYYRKGAQDIKDFLKEQAGRFRTALNRSGISLGVDDFLLLPASPDSATDSAPDEEGMKRSLEEALKKRPEDDSLRIIHESRAVKVDLMQLSGFRGYMRRLDDFGENVPILSNLAGGMSTLDYFISCHGSRAGLADKGLVIRVAGDFMNCMVQACQSQRIVEEDCGTDEAFWISGIREDDNVLLPLSKRITGRCLARDYTLNGQTIEAGTIIDPQMAVEFEKQAETNCNNLEIPIRSPITCRAINRNCDAWRLFCEKALRRRAVWSRAGSTEQESTGAPITEQDLERLIREGIRKITLVEENGEPGEEISVPRIRGICRKCYGVDPATGKPPETGVAVGIIAAQSIGEAGSQMTLRTFHTGGAASTTDCSIQFVRILLSKGNHVVTNVAPESGRLKVQKSRNGMKWLRLISSDSHSEWRFPLVSNGDFNENISEVNVNEGDRISEDNSISIASLIEAHGRVAAAEYLLDTLQKIYSSFCFISDRHFEILLSSVFHYSGDSQISLIKAGKSQQGILELLGFRGGITSLKAAGESEGGSMEYLYGLKARLASGTIIHEDGYWNKVCGGK